MGNEHDYDLSLLRLDKYSRINLLAEAVQVEKILLMGKPLTGVINETDFKYSAHSSLAEETVSRQIINEHNMFI